MKIVAFLQNQWFEDPLKMKERMEGPRREFWIRISLFYKCLTGKRLRKVFGDILCNSHYKDTNEQIIFEEVSKEIGGSSDSLFPIDPEHIKNVLLKHKPNIVLLFGKIAQQAIPYISNDCIIITGPHPASRQKNILEELERMNRELLKCIA